MMSETQVLQSIKVDLQTTGLASGKVIYLEGATDPELFFALLGVPAPRGGIHQDTLVKGFNTTDWGSGNETVRRYVQVAQARGYGAAVFGVVDGDGDEWANLVARFDPPHSGPLFVWKAYSIESLMPQMGWPSAWGAVPAWAVDLDCYAPYIALNRLHVQIRQALRTLDLHTFSNPVAGQLLRTAVEVETALRHDQHLLAGRDVAAEFAGEVSRVRAAFAAALEQGLATLNGKWLFSHFLLERTGVPRQSPQLLRQEWANHAVRSGGLSEVRELWRRITGSPP
jgi:hypothetical protein